MTRVSLFVPHLLSRCLWKAALQDLGIYWYLHLYYCPSNSKWLERFFFFFLSINGYQQWLYTLLIRTNSIKCIIGFPWASVWSSNFIYYHQGTSVTDMISLKGNRYSFKGNNSFQIVLLVFGEGYTLKEKNSRRLGAKSFLSELTPMQKGFGVEKSKQEISKVVSLIKNGVKPTQCIQLL